VSLRIESPSNERIKRALRLRDRATRDAEQRVLIEGFREVRRALEGGWKPEALFYCRPLFLGHHEDELIERCRALGADLLDCGESAFRKLSYRDRPDGLIAVAPQQRRTLDDLVLPPDPLLLVVEGVEKPGDLGTLLRTADAGGVDAVIVCDARTDLFNPNTVRSSVGALFLLPVAEATTAEAMAWLRARGVRMLAATPSGTQAHSDCNLVPAVALAVGSEQYGLTEAWMEGADERVLIPMYGRCDSLNVAAAATVLIFEAARQRRAAGRLPRCPSIRVRP
jgi:RNA methyltransferase, TrmH family